MPSTPVSTNNPAKQVVCRPAPCAPAEMCVHNFLCTHRRRPGHLSSPSRICETRHLSAHCRCHSAAHGGGVARSIFSMGSRHTTQIGRLPCITLSAHSTHIAMWPQGTSSADRGSSRQTAHGSVSSGAVSGSPLGVPLGFAPAGMSGEAGGVRSVPGHDPIEPFFLRIERLGNDVIGSGQRNRCRE